jgi:hypothetical protein
MSQRTLDAGGVTLAILLGVLAGPVIFYAVAGDYFHSTDLSINRLIAGALAIVLGIAAILNAVRFRNAGLAGAVTGLAAAVGELAVAALPWAGLLYITPHCAGGTVCPPTGTDLKTFALYVGAFMGVVSVIAGFSLASLVRVIRARFA